MAKSIPRATSSTSSKQLRYYGIYRAKCLNNADPEGRGRILAHIYIRDGQLSYSENSHQWVPVLTPYGGIRGMGMSMSPPIHADGFVIFEEGMPNTPVWIGAYPFAPLREVDEDASSTAGYTVIKTYPTTPPEQAQDPTRIVIKTQYPSLQDPSPESDDNAVENAIIMDENQLQLFHVNRDAYEYSEGGVGTGTPGSYIRLADSSIELGVTGQDGRTFNITIDSESIRLASSQGDQIQLTDGRIQIIGTDQSQVSITALENGSVTVNGKIVTVDGEQLIIGPPGAAGAGGTITTQCICPFTGLRTHVGSSKTIIGG